MKKGLLLIFLLSAIQFVSRAEFYVVTVVGNTFSPGTVTMNVGDTVVWVLPAGHTLTQVSEATWNSNDTNRIGFHVVGPDTVGLLGPTISGTVYYVCQIHASMGMKGKVIINPLTGTPKTFSENAIRTYPSLVSDLLHIEAPKASSLTLSIYNINGELVYKQSSVSAAENVHLGNLAGGMYVGILTDNERTYSWKFIKK